MHIHKIQSYFSNEKWEAVLHAFHLLLSTGVQAKCIHACMLQACVGIY